MQRFTVCGVLALGVLVSSAFADATVTVGPSTDPWLGYMNVSNLPAPDGDGAYQFGSAWGLADLVSEFDDGLNKLTLSPNTIADADPYWYIGGGGPGAAGNKIMEANLYIETTDVYNGQTLTFEGVVSSDTTTDAHDAFIFIKDFAPDYSSFNDITIPVTPGPFSISLATDAGAGRHVQWGFQFIGVNVWATDVEPFGNVMIRTIPEPASLSLLALAGLLIRRR